MKEQYFKCECGCGILHLAYDETFGLEIAMFERPVSRSWSNRLRLAWSALRGRPYSDMVVLHSQQIANLAEYLHGVQNHDIL